MREPKLKAEDLSNFYGSENLYTHWLRRFTYTDGTKYLAEQGQAYWLLDAIASHQPNPLVKQEPFQVWTLTVMPYRAAVLAMTDGNTSKPILSQGIEYTDFPLESIVLYLVADGDSAVLMLPSEY